MGAALLEDVLVRCVVRCRVLAQLLVLASRPVEGLDGGGYFGVLASQVGIVEVLDEVLPNASWSSKALALRA
jgi:hypothetical protein